MERGTLRSKESGKKSIHFNGSTQNIELLLQIVISVNQLSMYGAVADMIEELPVGQRAVGNHAKTTPRASMRKHCASDLREMMEQSIVTKLLMNARRRNSTILNSGQLR